MSIGISESSGAAAEERSPSLPIPGLAIAGLIAAGVLALMQRRERVSGGKPNEMPDALREDVGLPRRHVEPRGWWEWR